MPLAQNPGAKKNTLMKKTRRSEVVVYQAKTGALELSVDEKGETIWATQAQMAAVFSVNPQAITKHIKNIYKEKELSKKATCSKMEQVQTEGSRKVHRVVEIYNLDAIISVGYRINSLAGTKFRQWATKTLHAHIVDGYTINKKRIAKNYSSFLMAVNEVRKLLSPNSERGVESALELVKMFAATWFSLDAFDKSNLPDKGATKKQVEFTAQELSMALAELRHNLISKKEASELFGKERTKGGLEGIVGNIFQSFGGTELYPTLEEKAAHLLYFVVKNHPFTDGNKRSGAFSFIWFLKKAELLDITRLTPEALTALTLLVAESDPKDKDQLIGLILLLLSAEQQ